MEATRIKQGFKDAITGDILLHQSKSNIRYYETLMKNLLPRFLFYWVQKRSGLRMTLVVRYAYSSSCAHIYRTSGTR